MQIRIRHEDGREECMALDASQTARFGTRRSADVVLQGAGIFPVHFGILYYRNAFTVAASQRARKICVNGVRVRKAVLHAGDRIELGKTVITVVDSEIAAGQATTRAQEARPSSSQPCQRDHSRKDLDLSSLPTDSSADWLADLDEEIPDPLDDIPTDLLDAGPRQEMTPARRTQRAAAATPAERTSPPLVLRVLRSVWFTRVLVACVVLPLATLIGVYIGQLPTAEERFHAADQAYRQEDFPRAIEDFDQFLSRHPHHVLAGEARIKRDAARLLDRFDRGADAMTLVNETRVAVRRWEDEPLPADVQRGLAQILPPLVADLVRLAQAAAQRGAAEAAQDARTCAADGLRMIDELVPAALQRNRDIDQLQSALIKCERELDQTATLNAALREIQRAGAAGDLAAASRARQALLGEYPQLANNRQLLAAMGKVATSDAAPANRSAESAQPPQAVAADAAWRLAACLASGTASQVPASQAPAVRISVAETGSVYGLVPDNGTILWRQREERLAAAVPDPDEPRDYIVADESVVRVVSRDQGVCLSTYCLGHETGTVWLAPVVVHDCLLIFEQMGPHHTNVHVLRRGDQLQSVQKLPLSDVVANAPAVFSESVYLPMDCGHVQVLRYQANEPERPFAISGEWDVVEGPTPARHQPQLAIAQGKLWVGGCGVQVFEPAPAGARPVLSRRMWDDLQVTQPISVVNDDVVVVAGRTAAHAGVEVRAWGLAAEKILWLRKLGVPLQSPPLVSANQVDVWFLSSDDSVYCLPISRLGDATAPFADVIPLSQSQGTAAVPAAASGASLRCGDVGVLGPTVSGDALWIVTSLADARRAERIPLPQPLAALPVAFGQRLLLPALDGSLSSFDVQEHHIASSLLLPGTFLSAPRAWQTPAVTDDQQIVATDGMCGVFLLRLRADQGGLEMVQRATVEQPFAGRLIAVSNTVWGVDRQRQLVALTVPDLALAASQPLRGGVMWGPHVLGAYGYLATQDGQLYCLGPAAQPRWVVSLAGDSVVGGCAIDARHVALACATGTVWVVDSETGQRLGGPLDAREALESGPILIDRRLAVITRDGCILVTRETVDVLLRETAGAKQ